MYSRQPRVLFFTGTLSANTCTRGARCAHREFLGARCYKPSIPAYAQIARTSWTRISMPTTANAHEENVAFAGIICIVAALFVGKWRSYCRYCDHNAAWHAPLAWRKPAV